VPSREKKAAQNLAVRQAGGDVDRHLPRKREIPVGTLRSILSQAHISPNDWERLE